MIEIHNELLAWVVPLCFATLGFVIWLAWAKGKELSTVLWPQDGQVAVKAGEFHPLTFSSGRFNETLFSAPGVGGLFVVMVVGIMMLVLVGGRRFKENSIWEKIQLQFFMAISVVLVLICIGITGGFLDSPFTAALSIYIGGFLILQDRTDTQGFNRLLVAGTAVIILGAYAWLYYTGREMYFFTWRHEEREITLFRFCAAFAITAFSIWQADRTNKRIETLYKQTHDRV